MAYNYPYRDQDPLSTRIPSVPQSNQHPAKYAPELRQKRSRGSVFCQSLLALPWFVFSLGIIMLACSITWNKKFLDAAKQTGDVLKLAAVKDDSLLNKLWAPHKTIALATLAPAVVISLLVIATAAVQMATQSRRTPRGTVNSGWSTMYLGISGLLSLLMWFVMLWTVVLLVVSVVWLLSSVVVNSAAQAALRQAQAQSNATSIDLQAPDTPARLRNSYNSLLRPLLTKEDKLLTDAFLNSTIDAIKSVDLSKTCRATCMDLTRFEDSLGTTACICDTQVVRTFLAKSKSTRKAMISAVLCLALVLVSASLLLVVMVARTVWMRHALSFHSFRRVDSDLPMVLPPPPSPPLDDGQDEVFSIPSVTDPQDANSERLKMIHWQQAQAPSLQRYDSGRSHAPPPPRTHSPYYGSTASGRPAPSTTATSPRPSQVSATTRYGPGPTPVSPRYHPSDGRSSPLPSQPSASTRYAPTPASPSTRYPPTNPPSSHAAPSSTRYPPTNPPSSSNPSLPPSTSARSASASGTTSPRPPPLDTTSPKHGIVSTRSPNFTFHAQKSPTATSPNTKPSTTSPRGPASPVTSAPPMVSHPPPFVSARRYNFAAAHLEASRESALRASQQSDASKGSAFDEPEPDVIVDRNKRQYFQARAAQAQTHAAQTQFGAASPGAAWRIVQ